MPTAHAAGSGGINELLDPGEGSLQIPVEARRHGGHPHVLMPVPTPSPCRQSPQSVPHRANAAPPRSKQQLATVTTDRRCRRQRWATGRLGGEHPEPREAGKPVTDAGLGTAATSSTARQPLASVSMPRVPGDSRHRHVFGGGWAGHAHRAEHRPQLGGLAVRGGVPLATAVSGPPPTRGIYGEPDAVTRTAATATDALAPHRPGWPGTTPPAPGWRTIGRARPARRESRP
jgi:hypothetical protein